MCHELLVFDHLAEIVHNSSIVEILVCYFYFLEGFALRVYDFCQVLVKIIVFDEKDTIFSTRIGLDENSTVFMKRTASYRPLMELWSSVDEDH